MGAIAKAFSELKAAKMRLAEARKQGREDGSPEMIQAIKDVSFWNGYILALETQTKTE